MSQQDYNYNESIRQETSEVSIEGRKRRRSISISKKSSENALLIMKMANKGHIYETASKFAERSNRWAMKSDFLSPIVESTHTPVVYEDVTSDEQMAKEIELSKQPPNVTELDLYLDGLNNQPVESLIDIDNVVSLTDERAKRIEEAQNRVEAA